jgi:general secretion pathway protein K
MRPHPLRQQRGVAVLMALLIVTIATLAVSAMLWRQQVQLRALENRLALTQARALALSAIDWARLVLWEDLNLPGRAAYDPE